MRKKSEDLLCYKSIYSIYSIVTYWSHAQLLNVLHSCEVLELDLKICLKMLNFKSNHKIIRQQIIVGL